MNEKYININSLSKQELYELNELIINRLKEISRQEAAQQVSKYNVTDIVSFAYEGETRYGVVMRVNQKSVSLKMTDGSECRVSPSFLMKAANPPQEVVDLRKFLYPTPEEVFAELKKEGLIPFPNKKTKEKPR